MRLAPGATGSVSGVTGARAETFTAVRAPRLLRFAFRRVLKWSAAAFALLVALVAAANVWVLAGAGGQSTSVVAEVPHAQAAIVPGALVHSDGEMSGMLQARVDQAAELWHADKVDRILVSGDHGSWAYDEPTTMRKELVAQGVPPEVIFQDHAGFDTWSTVVRAREIFNVESAVIVTQGFHMPRALYQAESAGLTASGLTADTQEWGSQGTRRSIREVLARVKAVADVTTGADVMGGPPVPITGDGRDSWGPVAPAGTPPAGSPGR
jgi:SanA protein